MPQSATTDSEVLTEPAREAVQVSDASVEPAADVETLIRPPKGWEALEWRDVWAHRHLIYFLTWRDLIVRYKQTALGALWSILQPVLLMVVFGAVFQGNAGRTKDGLPYQVFLYAGLLPWTFVSQAASKAAMSLVSAEKLIEKVYFPRLVIPISAVVGALVDFAIAFGVLGVMMLWYRIPLTPLLTLLPLAVILLCLVSLAFGIFYASLNVRYRDFRHLLSFIMQIWMFTTWTIYDPAHYDHVVEAQSKQQQTQASSPAAMVTKAAAQKATGAAAQKTTGAKPAKGQVSASAEAEPAPVAAQAKPSLWKRGRHLLASAVSADDLNPLTAVVSFFRATIVGGHIPWFPLIKATVTTTLVLIGGVFYFRRIEGGFADII